MKSRLWVFVIFLSACSDTRETCLKDVRSVVAGILEADNQADIERVLSYYHSNAVLIPPGREEIRGKVNIRMNYEHIFATTVLDLFPEEEEITISRDNAIYIGRTKGTAVSKADSAERVINDKFIMILTKEDNRWQIKTLIWN